MTRLAFVYDDGGRADAGYVGTTGDCVTRAIAIATGRPYADAYADLHARAKGDRAHMAALTLQYGAQARRHASPRDGVARKVYDPYLAEAGWTWTPTMAIGQGCTVHLRAGEVPMVGPIIVRLSRHLAAVVDGVIRDLDDPSRGGDRCVYGYWRPE